MNIVDRYLGTVEKLGLPKYGWKTLKTAFTSPKRDIRMSFTGGFAKHAFAIFHADVPFTILVSDEVRDVLTTKSEKTFIERANFHKERAAIIKEEKTAVAYPVMIQPVITEQITEDPIVKNGGKIIAQEAFVEKVIQQTEDPVIKKRLEQKAKLKKLFDNHRWDGVGFAGEGETGTFMDYLFYFGPSRYGNWYFKINEVSCSRKRNQPTLEQVKEAAFESLWTILMKRQEEKTQQVAV